MKTIFCKLFFIGFFLWVGKSELKAGAPDGVDPISGNPSAPIDSGILSLVAGGLALGYRKWKMAQKEKTI